MLSEYIARMPKENVPSQLAAAIEEHGTPEAFVDYLFANTRILTEYPLTREKYITDPMVQFAGWFADALAQNRKYAFRNLSNVPAIDPHLPAGPECDAAGHL